MLLNVIIIIVTFLFHTLTAADLCQFKLISFHQNMLNIIMLIFLFLWVVCLDKIIED